jgi:3-hydroxyacyl-CoA dehydrogenase
MGDTEEGRFGLQGGFLSTADSVGSDSERVVILGANGVMGIGAAEVFAAGGYQVTMLARDQQKAADALAEVQALARAEAISESIEIGAYSTDLERSVAGAAIIFEALAEDLELKRSYFERVDRCRRPDSIVATVSSGLSIAAMAEGRSESFRRHFLGIHLFNPPHMIVGTEVIPHTGTDPAVVAKVSALLSKRLGRRLIVAADRPAFAANRIAFKTLNEVAQLVPDYGVVFLDYLIGPHTGRAMAPLATIDLVGWDVHEAIVDNVHAHARDEAHALFKLPDYMKQGIARGHLGDKTPARGGFYRRTEKGVEVLDTASGTYHEAAPPAPIQFVERMKTLHRVGRYRESLAVLKTAQGGEADLARRVVLGYISYALNRVGEVAATNGDIDTIMSYGFNWAPPSVLVDLLGAADTVELMRRYELNVPQLVERAAAEGRKLYAGSVLDFGRTFVG